MEADWSVEIGVDLPRIVVPWAEAPPGTEDLGLGGLRFVDLRGDAEGAKWLAEAQQFPMIGHALMVLNSAASPGFTSKCDVFSMDADEIDPLEFNCDTEVARGLGCYIDLLLRDEKVFASFAAHEAWLRRMVQGLRDLGSLRCARADLVLRAARVFELDGFGVTLYVSACGANQAYARARLDTALDRVIGFLVAVSRFGVGDGQF